MATYNYKCDNEECELEGFSFSRPMSEYKEPKECPKCGTMCKRAQGDWCRNFRLKGAFWYRDGYAGNNYKDELRKAGKDPGKWDGI